MNKLLFSEKSISQNQALSHKILCLGSSWFPNNPGGLDRYVYELVKHLAQSDQVELCGLDLPQETSYSNLQLTNLATADSDLIKRFWQIRSHFQTKSWSGIDTINLHFAMYAWPTLNSLPKDIPVTFNFHGPWALESQQEGAKRLNVQIKHWIESQVYRRCDRFIVLSQAFGQILHQEYGIPWERIHVIPGGVDVDHFQPSLSRQDARIKLGWSTDRAILFTSRRLVHRMGLQQLLIAVDQLRHSVPEVWLAIAGKGPLRNDLERQVAELDLSHHVRFLGFLPDEDLPVAYQAADLTVMPSQSLEGFGLVLLESLASGTPAVCTPVGGMPEAIAPLSSELIFPSSTAIDIAEHLKQLLLGQISLPSRQVCRTYVVEGFNWNSIAQQIRTVLLAEK